MANIPDGYDWMTDNLNKLLENKEIDKIWNDESAKRDFDKAYKLFQKQEYERSVEFLMSAAHKGHVEAQFRLGSLYYDGVGVGRDFFIALSWFKSAAESGYGEAMYWLGNMFEFGLGTVINLENAYYWYESAELRGVCRAMNALGFFYKNGTYVDKDESKALQYIRKSANFDDPLGQSLLAEFYLHGICVEVDILKAENLAKKSSDSGCIEGHYLYGMIRHEQGKENGIQYISKAAEGGHEHAQAYISRIE